jgi:hypothetical protein
MARNTELSFEKFTKSDVEKLVEWINCQEYTAHTKHDYKVILKKILPMAQRIKHARTRISS